MNNKKWLVRVVSLTAMLGLTLGLGIFAACTPSGTHTHSYTQWAHDDTQHWKVCPDDNTADESTKAAHSFTDGVCECGATEGTVDVPDIELDTREFYVVGGGMGDLKDATWNTCAAQYKFTKAEKADANGNTVYTYQLKLYSGDEFKFIQPTTIDAAGEWDDSTVLSFYDFDTTAVAGTFKDVSGNVAVEVDADGLYEFTIRTKKGGDIHANKVEFKLVEKLPSMSVLAQYDMYIVGSISSKPTSGWPSLIGVENVPSRCIRMELQDDGQTFSVQVKLSTSDAFKVWNYKLGNKDAGYYPTGVGGDLSVKLPGDYIVSWKVGENTVSVVAADPDVPEIPYNMYLVGKIESIPGSRFPSAFNTNAGSVEDNCLKMTPAEDGETFTAEVYLTTNDAFAVYNLSTKAHYPSGATSSVSLNSLHVEENNTYLITWKVGDATPTVVVHEHPYTEWDHDTEFHWKKCASDGTPDMENKAAHSYNEENVCECGAITAASCKHEKGFLFAYDADTAPAPEAEGGKLTKVCPDCNATEEVDYKNGVDSANHASAGKTYKMDSVGNYYLQFSGTAFIGFVVSEAGTYTLTFTDVYVEGGKVLYLKALAIKAGAFETMMVSARAIIATGKWSTNATQSAKREQYNIVVDGYAGDTFQRFNSISFTFTAEDLAEGDLYVNMNVGVGVSVSNVDSGYIFAELSKTEPAAAATASAPAEVAMLPKKED